MRDTTRPIGHRLLTRLRRDSGKFLRSAGRLSDDLFNWVFPARGLRRVARRSYSYHNLGPDAPPVPEERTPCGGGERYNFDRMYMMVSNYDFAEKSLLDLGCNSGWFCFQAQMLGARTVGVDYRRGETLGSSLDYAIQLERRFRLGLRFVNENLDQVDFSSLTGRFGYERFDAALLLSVLHHIGGHDVEQQAEFFAGLYASVKDVIFYEDHEFWNDMTTASGTPIELRGKGYRYGWNEDLSWQRRIDSIERFQERILYEYSKTWRQKVLMLDDFSEVRFLGFSEKRRPMLALFKPVEE